MKLINYSMMAIMLCLLASCSKELSLELGDVDAAKTKAFHDLVATKKFQLKGFYSDVLVDYIENDDTVKQETNLWPYVSNYLKDDYNIFLPNGTDVTVMQNQIKMPGINEEVLHKKYHVSKDKYGVHIDFLDYKYSQLKYDLYKTGTGYFILSIKWKQGAILYSRFEVVP